MQTSSRARWGPCVAVAVIAAFLITASPASAAKYYPLGNNDTLYVFTPAETIQLDYRRYPNTAGWEGQICRFLRFTPAKGACTATNALNVLGKQRLRWFVYNARLHNACGAVIWDYGSHGVNVFKKRWKVRPPTDFDTLLELPWVTPGTFDRVRLTKPSSQWVDVTC